MSDTIMIDTDILIDVGREESQAIKYLQGIEQDRQLLVSVITQMELIVGCRDKNESKILELLCGDLK